MKSMKNILLLWGMVFICFSGLSQTAKITGKVINAASGQALSGANVFLVEKTKAITTLVISTLYNPAYV